jgi:uncharacterized alpha-E superfamily protein
MLLGRTANGLYWMARYFEQSREHVASHRCRAAHGATRTQSAAEEWTSVVVSAGDTGFRAKHMTTRSAR